MTWNIDPSHTQIEFSVRHMMIAKVRGQFESFEGQIHLNAQNLAESWAEGTIDAGQSSLLCKKRTGEERLAKKRELKKMYHLSQENKRMNDARQTH